MFYKLDILGLFQLILILSYLWKLDKFTLNIFQIHSCFLQLAMSHLSKFDIELLYSKEFIPMREKICNFLYISINILRWVGKRLFKLFLSNLIYYKNKSYFYVSRTQVINCQVLFHCHHSCCIHFILNANLSLNVHNFHLKNINNYYRNLK